MTAAEDSLLKLKIKKVFAKNQCEKHEKLSLVVGKELTIKMNQLGEIIKPISEPAN